MRPRPLITFPIWPPKEFVPSPTLCFVLMPFSDRRVAAVYSSVVEPAIRKAGLAPNRADERYGADVMHDIWAGLNEARLVVADLTGRNANVFYEVGIAHTLGKPLLLLSADGGKQIPFDLNRFRHILYRGTPDGLRRLRRALGLALPAVLREFPTGHRLINEVEAEADAWRGPTRDPGRLHDYAPDRLNLLLDSVRPQDLSDEAVSFCAACACHWALPAHMIHWGSQCHRRPAAALDLCFGLFDHQRRPPLRIAHLLAQMTALKPQLAAQLREYNVKKTLRGVIEQGDVATYVRQRYRELALTAGERDELLALFGLVQLPRLPGGPTRVRGTRSRT